MMLAGVVIPHWFVAGLALAPPAADLEFFETQVRPLLAEHCFECHGPRVQKASLRLDHIASILEGGESGAVLVPFDPRSSRLFHAVSYSDVELQMPPRGRLPPAAIEVLQRWIEIGAPWGSEPRPQERGASEPTFDLASRVAGHWCYQPIVAGDAPVAEDDAWSRDPLDRFVLAELRAAGLEPAPPADRATLLRRVTFDLHGLPPSPERVAAFLADDDPLAYERHVDELLASPRFGERFARHWMDRFRYAETYGHEFDYPIVHAQRYRDYLIRALNADVPYDAMVTEHLAGDLLERPRFDPETGVDESILATAHYFFPQATHGPVDARQDEADRVDNQIDAVTKSFLGLTVSCARCHDHKFDAISQRDYYALAGYLKSSRRQTAFLDPHARIADAATRLEEIRRERDAHLATVMAAGSSDLADEAARYAAFDAGLPPATIEWEAEELATLAVSRGDHRVQDLAHYGAGRFSGDAHTWWTGAAPGARLELALDVPVTGDYRLAGAFTRARDYAIVRLLLDDVERVPALDLYAEDVAPSGDVDLGLATLAAGRHVLAIEIVGCNPAAVPAYMFGFDRLRLTSTLSPEARNEATRRAAVAAGLDEQRLARYVALPPAGSGRSGAFDRESLGAHDVLFADFAKALGGDDDVASLVDWRASGHAFALACADEIPLGVKGRTEPVGVDCVHSGLLSPRLEGALRSRSFTVEHDYVHYRLQGDGARVRVIVDSYQLDVFNALLFEGFTFDVEGGHEWAWRTQRIAKHRGQRAHVELLDEGAGWLAVDAIVFSDSEQPPRDVLPSTGELRGPPDLRYLLADPALEALDAERSRIEREMPTPLHALALQDGFPEDEYVFLRGRHQSRGDTVPRRFLEALGSGGAPRDGETGSGRLELAKALLDPGNPLPPRVAVNRIWHHLLGRGIVATVDDFGKLGAAPSHPALLDHLAAWFVAEGRWSQKALIRRIVTSSTYRQSSASHDARFGEIDPENRLLHRANVRRLEGEAIRDALLAVAGTLDPEMYGPAIPLHLTPFLDGRGRPSRSGPLDGANRRSVYQEVRRNFLPPFQLAFDMPVPAQTAGRRSVSNVPAQGLILMNDPFVVEMARRLGERAMREAGDERSTIDLVHRLLYARGAEPAEVDDAVSFLRAQEEDLGRIASQDDAARRAQAFAHLCHALITAKEFWFLR
jgi:hypothetical protein